ncbi:MAG: hypothetical protein GX373_08270, partial [Gammaproteobacteria bacterium]|nr:hypothetical protein [Gammaproteobacteria bacterium]
MSNSIEDYEYDFPENANNGQEKNNNGLKTPMARRFRGYLPVVIDVETGG